MPFGEIKLQPGVNTERTPTLNEAGVSQSQLIRYKDGLIQKYGGWDRYYEFLTATTLREMHAWSDFRPTGDLHIGVGATQALQLLTNSSGSFSIDTITPQTLNSDIAPNFSTVINTATVTVIDTNVSNLRSDTAVYFETPVSVGGIILSGLYPIASIVGVSSYTITAATAATSTVNNGGAVPSFATTTDSAVVTVTLAKHGLAVNDTVVFDLTTTGNGVTVFGSYAVATIVSVDAFTITASTQATAAGSFSMNSGLAGFLYYITVGPVAAGVGYGLGLYGAGLYGYGTSGGSSQTGTPITATDWTIDNWGSLMVACPDGGGIYYYDPTGGFSTATLVSTGPIFNEGIFVSTSQQILVAWGSAATEDIGVIQDAMWVQWCDSGNFFEWTPATTNLAGGFRIPIGSKIMGGMAVQNQNFIWTDLDLWVMNFQGLPGVFGFNKIGSGAGLVAKKAAMQMRGNVYWMGQRNFYSFTPGGVSVIPCPVWDVVFQNLNTDYLDNIRAMPNTPFNEVGWLYPSADSVSGECDSYVKFNITEQNAPWDFGQLARAAWIDQSALGMPLAGTSNGIIYQHETTNNADGAAIVSSFTTSYAMIGNGEDFVIVDQVLPDMKWGTYSGASDATIQLTFNVVDYPGETPRVYGPYSVTQATTYISTRFRGRQMSVTLQSQDAGSFWRLGRIRYRWTSDGRR